jgi:phosphoribosyl 1,2-cyclic phosphate phosphodiesterase
MVFEDKMVGEYTHPTLAKRCRLIHPNFFVILPAWMPAGFEMLLLGTAAAECWPAPFCACDACRRARNLKGPNLRLRSGALIDNDLKIDFGPDTVAQMQSLARDLVSVKTILLTHEHGDHLCTTELEWASRPYTLTPASQPIQVFGNARVLSEIRRLFPNPIEQNLDLRLLEPFREIATAAGDIVLPLPANHCPDALLLHITRNQKTLFYGHDSGHYPRPTLEALAKGPKIDLALFDCTYGPQPSNNQNHMNTEGVIQMIQELRSRNALSPNAKCIATHFSHNGGASHEELLNIFAGHQIDVAFDGMKIQIV